MKIGPDEVARVARLARLELSEDKLEVFAPQLDDILRHMDKLAEVDTGGVEPMYSPVEHVSVLRADEPRSECGREDVLSNAPESDGQFFIVPKIV